MMPNVDSTTAAPISGIPLSQAAWGFQIAALKTTSTPANMAKPPTSAFAQSGRLDRVYDMVTYQLRRRGRRADGLTVHRAYPKSVNPSNSFTLLADRRIRQPILPR